MRTCLVAYFLAACCLAFASHELEVEINARGITGTIRFIELNETSVRVIADLQGLQGEQTWHVHQLPVDQTVDPAVQCLSSWVGGHYDPTNAIDNPNYATECNPDNPAVCEYGDLAGRLGLLPANGQLDAIDSTGHIQLEGLFSIAGRSIVIHEPPPTAANFECGTIRYSEEMEGAEVVILQSILVNPIAGRIYFKQVEGQTDVQIWGKLYWVNDSATTLDHNWHIHRDLGVETYRTGSCGETGPHYDPLNKDASSEGYSMRCTPQTPTMCEIGDLTGKLDIVNVAASPSPYSNQAFFFTDSYLNLTGTYPVINRAIVIHVPGRGAPRVSCAPLVNAENITLEAFRRRGQASLAVFSQYSRFERTQVSLGTLPGENRDGLSVVTAAFNPNTACPADDDSLPSDSTYTPYSPLPGVQTPDGSPLGAISSIYNDYVMSGGRISAFDLPLFGAMTTISGRTLRYTYGNSRECGALLPRLPPGYEFTTAKAAFSGNDIGGAIYFMQYRGEDDIVTGSTFIVVDIYYTQDTPRTMNHEWQVYENSPSSGQMCAGNVGDLYNPYSVSVANSPQAENSMYTDDCNGNYQLRCAKGDLDGKHGLLDIGSANMPNRSTYVYVDNNLELGGQFSILGRSVGLHRPNGGALFDCAVVESTVMSEYYVYTSVSMEREMTRVELAQRLTDGITSPDNAVVINQYVNSGCVMSTLMVMGSDEDDLEDNMAEICDRVSEQFNDCPADAQPMNVCPGFLQDSATHVSTSHLLFLSLLLISALSLMVL